MTETIVNGTVLLCVLVKEYRTAAEEQAMYLSLPELSRDSFSTFKLRCAKCAKKGYYLVHSTGTAGKPVFWVNSTTSPPPVKKQKGVLF